jgi:putative DNA primase/helicase
MEEPGTRGFDFDPIDERVRGHRGTYLAAIFTITRAFIAAGCPKQEGIHSVAGYEEWSRWVRQPLIWLGMDDPCSGMTEARALDPKLEELKQLLDVLKKYRDKIARRFTVADCAKLADEMSHDSLGRQVYLRPDLRDLMMVHGKMDNRAFGHLLRRCRDRRIDGWFIKFVSDSRNYAVYQLMEPPPPEKE